MLLLTRSWEKLVQYPQNWIQDWSQLSTLNRTVPGIAIAGYWGVYWGIGRWGSDVLTLGVAVLLLSYLGPFFRQIRTFILPLILTGMVYNSQHLFVVDWRGPIHVAEPYFFDRTYFGIPSEAGVLTPNEWWQLRTHPVLDVITGFAYLTYVAGFLLMAGILHFWVGPKGKPGWSARHLQRYTPRMMWVFFAVNVLGYLTYFLYPAAPPWYVSEHGWDGPIKLDVASSPAGAARVDALFGMTVFQNMYSLSANVFGAIPSLHVAYPLLGFYYASRVGVGRVPALAFYLLMCFSAVYLNHHYVLDILVGSSYALMIAVAVDLIWRVPRHDLIS